MGSWIISHAVLQGLFSVYPMTIPPMHKNGSLIEAREQGLPCAGLVHHEQYFMVPPALRNPKEETVIQGREEQMCKQSTELFCNKIHCFVQWKHLHFCRRVVGKVRAAFWHLPQVSSWQTGRGEKVSLRILLGESQDRTFLNHFRSSGKGMLLRRLCRLSATHGLCQRGDGFPHSNLWTHACNTPQV